MNRSGHDAETGVAGSPSIRIGCSGWFYWHWRGRFYPETLPTKGWFSFYRRRFRTVELNAPFYRWPTLSTVKTWRKQSTPGFKYCVKANRLITHEKRFRGTKRLVKDFCALASILEDRMGAFLFQCPPSFHYSYARLGQLTDQLVGPWPAAVEFRHRSWWNETVFQEFEEAGLIFCSVSGPRLPTVLVRTAREVYVRFHGVTDWYRYDYPRAELARWAGWIKHAAASGWIFFNNDSQAFAIKNARQIGRMLGEKQD